MSQLLALKHPRIMPYCYRCVADATLSQIPFEHCGKHMGRRNLRSEEDPVTARSGYSLCVIVFNATAAARTTIVTMATLAWVLKRRRNASLFCLVPRDILVQFKEIGELLCYVLAMVHRVYSQTQSSRLLCGGFYV